MSKIGRKPIALGGTKVEVQGKKVNYTGKKASGSHELPEILSANVKDAHLYIIADEKNSDTNRLWGLHRALIANKIKGADEGFTKELRIIGLGYKAISKGTGLQLSLGYTHKIDFDLPKEVAVEIDKTGQILIFKSPYKDLLGQICSDIRSLRPPEPYKGTGIQYATETVRRKAGKTK